MVTGGGAFVSGSSVEAWLNTSSPEPAGGTSATPEQGWIAFAYNEGARDETLHVYAICLRR